GRAYDQIRQGVCIGKLNVKITGSSSGLSDFGDGATHQAVEDIAIMRAVPNMTLLVPCDGTEMRKATIAAAKLKGPVYIRTCRNDLPDIFPENEPFVIGKPYVLREGSDVAVFAAGVMVSAALKAADALIGEGISVKVVNTSTLKPFNNDAVLNIAKSVKGAVTAEEHSCIGGLSEAVAFALKGTSIPLESIAIQDRFGQSAHNYDELLSEYGLTYTDIMMKIRKIMKR
ncbi:MAG: transketolase C-terminal domain-containing protein, partial [Eubacteriales bacterium]|nr:transketolase C-terminal domain-containing protein [Eubacteriales bacterium]